MGTSSPTKAANVAGSKSDGAVGSVSMSPRFVSLVSGGMVEPEDEGRLELAVEVALVSGGEV